MPRRTVALALSVVAVAAVVATALASIPASDGTINGCYDPSTGAPHPLSVVDKPGDCPATLLPFNQRGPTGPAGTVGTSRVQAVEFAPLADDAFGATATCPAGQVLLGGGFDLDNFGDHFEVRSSRPSVTVRGWDVKLVAKSPAALTDPFGPIRGFLSRMSDVIEEARANALAQQRMAEDVLSAIRRLASGGFRPAQTKALTKDYAKVKKETSDLRKDLLAQDRAISRMDDLAGVPPAVPAGGAYALCGTG